MKLRILLISIIITFVGILAYSFVSTELYYESTLARTRETLAVYMNVYDEEYSALGEAEAEAFSQKLGGARVTFISADGTVLADSEDVEVNENHLDRAEVSQAAEEGGGYAVRRSATVGVDYVYYCRAMTGYGGVYFVRIAVPTSSEWALYADFLPTVAVYLVIDLLACVLFTYVATYFILQPVESLTRQAALSKRINTKYKELQPIAEVLNERNEDIERKMSYAELLASGMMTKEQQDAAYKTILKQSERLTNLIACIINYNEIDNSDVPSCEVDLSKLAKEMLAVVKPEADKRKVTLIDNVTDNVIVQSTHERMSEMVGNLIRNAIRYNKEGGSVKVTLDIDHFEVADTGIGISEENLKKVFSRFFTVDKSHSGKNGGFGLGLAMVKKICQREGWTISVKSREGEGSTFTVKF